MTSAFAHLRQLRHNMIAFIERHENELHVVPDGFSNSIFWNFAHCVVTQQLLCYKLAGQDVQISEHLIDQYKKGTKAPTAQPSKQEVEEVKALALVLVDKMEANFNSGLFRNYNEYATSFKVTLTSIEDAILFNNLHEGLHLGYMMAMVKK